MKKLIPFDIEKARNGAKVVTETGQPVTIINFNLQIEGFTKKYILGRYLSYIDEDEVYECWPVSGKFDDGVGRPPNLMIEEEVEEKGYSVSGQCVMKNGKPYFCVFLASPVEPDTRVDDVLNQIADALNKADEIGVGIMPVTLEILQAENRSLNAWKESQLKVWGEVINFVYEYEHNGLNIGDSVAEWVLRRLKEVTHLYDISNKLRDEIRVIKGQAK